MSSIYQHIKDAGFIRAVITYSGGNDDGSVDDVSVYRTGDANPVQIVKSIYVRQGVQYVKVPNPDANEDLYDALAIWAYDQLGSFAGEFDVRGTFDIDAEAEDYRHHGSITQWVSFEGDWF